MSSSALFIVIMLLIAAFFTSYFLQEKKVTAIHETVISIFAGMRGPTLHPWEHLACYGLNADLYRYDHRSSPASERRLRQGGRQLRLPDLLQRPATSYHPRIRLRAPSGQLLPKHRHNIDLCLCRHLPVGSRHWRYPMALHPCSPRRPQHDLGRCHLRWRNTVRHRPGYYPCHLQLVQSRSEAIYNHLRRVNPERCHCHCHLSVGAEGEGGICHAGSTGLLLGYLDLFARLFRELDHRSERRYSCSFGTEAHLCSPLPQD